MLVIKQFLIPLTSIVFFVYIMEVSGKLNGFIASILQNIFFNVPQNVIRVNLDLDFCVNCSFNMLVQSCETTH